MCCCVNLELDQLLVLRMVDVFANGLKTARVVKLIFHTVLWGVITHTHTLRSMLARAKSV